MANDKSNKLDKLSALMGGGVDLGGRQQAPDRGDGGRSEDGDEEKIAEDAQKVLDLVASLAGENIFDMQVLIEFCADELRSQIREQTEGEE
jgi:hypothetical protein